MHANLLAITVGVESEDGKPISIFEALLTSQMELSRRKDTVYLQKVSDLLDK